MGTAYTLVCSARNRERWLEGRREGIGASEAGAVLGLNPYCSAYEVYLDKLGMIASDEQSDLTWWGHSLEPLILKRFNQRHPRVRVGRGGVLLRSRLRPWQLATLDARQTHPDREGPGIVEAKSTMFEWEGGVVPPDVYAQAQHQMDVTGFNWGTVVCFNRTSCELSEWPVEQDDEFIEEMREGEEKFWRDLVAGVAPVADGSESCRKALLKRWPEHKGGKVIDLGPEFADIDDALVRIKADIKALEAEKSDYENRLRAAIGDAERATMTNGASYTFKSHYRNGYTVEPTTVRQLRRSAKGGR